MNSSISQSTYYFFLAALVSLALAGSARAQVTEHKLFASDGEADDRFGTAVSLEGDRLLVGSPQALSSPDRGAGYIFERQPDGSWMQVAQLTASDSVAGGGLGVSVSLSGGRAILGAPEKFLANGSAYVFERQSGDWVEVAKLTASDGGSLGEFGFSVSISGTIAFVGSPQDGNGTGSVYVFERQGDGTWTEVAKLTASDGVRFNAFGSSVSVTGGRAAVGAGHPLGPGTGSAYVFERQGDGSWLEVGILAASDGAAEDQFGVSVSLAGETILVGAVGDDAGTGSAYVFERQGDGSWTEEVKLIASDAQAGTSFGVSVSLSGDRALVGAQLDRFFGSAYRYVKLGGGWSEDIKLTATETFFSRVFGGSVSISGGQSLVGAPGDFEVAQRAGAAHVFEGSSSPVANEATAELPGSYVLSETYPNPFNPQTQFSLEVATTQRVRIDVLTILGQRVAVLQDGLIPAGAVHNFTFEAGSLPSGVYLLRITGGTFMAIRSMTLLK